MKLEHCYNYDIYKNNKPMASKNHNGNNVRDRDAGTRVSRGSTDTCNFHTGFLTPKILGKLSVDNLRRVVMRLFGFCS